METALGGRESERVRDVLKARAGEVNARCGWGRRGGLTCADPANIRGE